MTAVTGGFFVQRFGTDAPVVPDTSRRFPGTWEVSFFNPSTSITAQVQAIAYCATGP
jgi:hypothetical protein